MTISIQEYRSILRLDLVSFIQRSFHELHPSPEYLHGNHIDVIATKLDELRQGSIKRLLINLPPRSLKSHCASVAFVAWVLGLDPTLRIICASYGQDLSDKLARDCRQIMQSAWYKAVFATRLKREALGDLITTEGGGRMSTSVGGVLTGRGADLIIIDDPLKPDEALSDTRRKAVNQWYDHSLVSRLNNKNTGRIAIIMQRLHQDDLTGHVQDQDKWDTVSFSAIAEQVESHKIVSPFGESSFDRMPGDLLHPAHESREALEMMRRTTGSWNFSSQYQQRPLPIGGGIVKREWLKFYDSAEKPESFWFFLQSWDTANKAEELNDYSVCTTWGIAEQGYFLLNVFRERVNYPDLKRAVRSQAECFPGAEIVIEDKASGTQLIQEIQHEWLYNVKPYVPPAGTTKLMRLNSQTPAIEGGRVWLPKDAPWLNAYVAELTGFPGTKYDDQVDSTAQALHHLQSNDSCYIWCR